MSKKAAKKVAEEIEKIEIPSGLQQRSKLGIEQAKQERRKTTRSKRFLKKTAAIAAGIVLAVGLGAATSPTFASFIKSLFLSSDVDEGLKNAVHQGYSEVVDMEVTDQGITLKVKEVITDPYRVSVLIGLEKDGKALQADQFILGDNPKDDDPELDPFNVNKVGIYAENGDKLDRSFPYRTKTLGNDIMVYFSLDDSEHPSSSHEVSNIPDNIIVNLDIIQIGDKSGQWHLNVPIDLGAAKEAVKTISLNKRYESPFGFSIDFLQLRHGPSKTELFYRFNHTKKPKDPREFIHYEIKDNKDRILASYDSLSDTSEEKGLENKNYLGGSGEGSRGYFNQYDAFLPFKHTDNLRLELKTIYTLAQTEDFSAVFHGNEVLEQPLVKEYEGKKVTFTTRMKTEEAEERFPDGEEVFSGTGWIIEVDQLLDSETAGFYWQAEDEQGNELNSIERKAITSKDADGNYQTEEWFFFHNKGATPEQVTLHFNEYLKANAVNWSIPLESSTGPKLEPNLDVYDVTVAELEPAIVKKAEQAINELIPRQPVEIIGADEYDDVWVVFSTNGGVAHINKGSGEVLEAFRYLPYDKVDKKIRTLAEHAIEDLESKLNDAFHRVSRFKSVDKDNWFLLGNRTSVTIDAPTERVEASITYTPEQINAKAKEAAEHAYAVMTNGKKLRLADGELVKTPEEHIWKLESRAGSFRFHIGAMTNTLWSVSEVSRYGSPDDDVAFEQPYYTNEAAIAAAKPFVKKLFQIDLDGYEVKVHLNEYTFTKNGEPTIQAKINTQGTFWEYQLLPEQGIKD